MFARVEGTIMRMAVAHGVHPGVEPTVLHLDTKTWRMLRTKAMKCPYVPVEIKRHLTMARKSVTSRRRMERWRARRKQ